MSAARPQRRRRAAALLVSAGLLGQAATLVVDHPLAFVLFILPGGILAGAGALLYLWSLVTE